MQQDVKTPRLEIADYQISRPVSGQWQLRILWRCTNRSDRTLYLLAAHPRPIVAADDFVTLDHSSPDDPEELYFNDMPGFEIVAVSSGQAVERWLGCNLAQPDSVEAINVVGRFGYHDAPPDPDWERTRNWMQVAKWQQIVNSDAFSLKLKN